MATFTKQILSGSTNGRPISLTAVATPGTTLHTAHATALDEVWLWCCNTDASATRKLTVELGGVTSPGDLIEVGIAAESGLVLVVPGLVLTGSVVIRAFAEVTAVLNVVGYANRVA